MVKFLHFVVYNDHKNTKNVHKYTQQISKYALKKNQI